MGLFCTLHATQIEAQSYSKSLWWLLKAKLTEMQVFHLNRNKNYNSMTFLQLTWLVAINNRILHDQKRKIGWESTKVISKRNVYRFLQVLKNHPLSKIEEAKRSQWEINKMISMTSILRIIHIGLRTPQRQCLPKIFQSLAKSALKNRDSRRKIRARLGLWLQSWRAW